MILGQRIINAILRPLVALFLAYDVQGRENLPRQGPVLVAMNHVNFVDVVLPGMFLPRDVVMLSKEENFHSLWLGPFVRAYGSLPVRRGEVDLRAIRLCLQALERGQVLVIAPEGHRSGDGCLQPGHDGLAYLASRVDVPIVPFVMYGHTHLKANIPWRRTPLHIRVGRPFRFVRRERYRREDQHAMTEVVMYRLAALLPPEYRGPYADLSAEPAGYVQD